MVTFQYTELLPRTSGFVTLCNVRTGGSMRCCSGQSRIIVHWSCGLLRHRIPSTSASARRGFEAMKVGHSDVPEFWDCQGAFLAFLGYWGCVAGKPCTIPEMSAGLCPNPERRTVSTSEASGQSLYKELRTESHCVR